VTEPEQPIEELAGRLFDMARSGDTATLAAYLDAGVPVNLTNGAGDTLVMLAAAAVSGLPRRHCSAT
jgi:uncharacterized protein